MDLTDRIRRLNSNTSNKNGKYILYWMQSTQRISYNFALNYSIELSNEFIIPLIVYFEINSHFPEANSRHFKFMIEGLLEIKDKLKNLGIKFILSHSDLKKTLLNKISKDSYCVITDKDYLKYNRKWKNIIAKSIAVPLIEVESNVVVPVEITSNKEEYSAAAIRRKITPKIDNYLISSVLPLNKHDSLDLLNEYNKYSIEFEDVQQVLESLNLDKSINNSIFIGGEETAQGILDEFIETKLSNYSEKRNDPSNDFSSNLSPYLHFGQISPIDITLRVKEIGENINTESFLEELIVRRELAINFVYYNKNYDNYSCLSNWAHKSLNEHLHDKREYIYSLSEFENANTHDIYWNAAQTEMVKTGKMHGYMRMYWGKKILEWSYTPEEAFDIALKLNNKYELDGRDPNGFAGVAWCFGKHDRPWVERSVFGMVRYMNANGLKRKFNIAKYVEMVNNLI